MALHIWSFEMCLYEKYNIDRTKDTESSMIELDAEFVSPSCYIHCCYLIDCFGSLIYSIQRYLGFLHCLLYLIAFSVVG